MAGQTLRARPWGPSERCDLPQCAEVAPDEKTRAGAPATASLPLRLLSAPHPGLQRLLRPFHTSAIYPWVCSLFLPPLAPPLIHTVARVEQGSDPHLTGGTKGPREAQRQPPAQSNAPCTMPSGVQCCQGRQARAPQDGRSVRQPGLQSVNSLPYVLTGPPFKPQNREELSKTLRLEVKERKDGVVRMP